MKTKIITAIIVLVGGGAMGSVWIDDPSVNAIAKDDIHSGERFRMLADFNADGILDMALSEDTNEFGNAGGNFTLYLGNANGKYHKYGEFFAHTMAVSLEKIGTNVRLWTYVRGGGGIGGIGYYDIQKDKLSERHSIIIHSGDMGTKMGRAIYKAVINNSDLPVIVEKSVTNNGIVKWINPNQQVEPIVTTPVDEVEAQSTQAHP